MAARIQLIECTADRFICPADFVCQTSPTHKNRKFCCPFVLVEEERRFCPRLGDNPKFFRNTGIPYFCTTTVPNLCGDGFECQKSPISNRYYCCPAPSFSPTVKEPPILCPEGMLEKYNEDGEVYLCSLHSSDDCTDSICVLSLENVASLCCKYSNPWT